MIHRPARVGGAGSVPAGRRHCRHPRQTMWTVSPPLVVSPRARRSAATLACARASCRRASSRHVWRAASASRPRLSQPASTPGCFHSRVPFAACALPPWFAVPAACGVSLRLIRPLRSSRRTCTASACRCARLHPRSAPAAPAAGPPASCCGSGQGGSSKSWVPPPTTERSAGGALRAAASSGSPKSHRQAASPGHSCSKTGPCQQPLRASAVA